MTQKEYFDDLKKNGLHRKDYMFAQLFEVDNVGNISSKEGVWFELMFDGVPLLISTNTPRSELEKFEPTTAVTNKPLERQFATPKDSPFTSSGYPFSKTLSNYNADDLGRAFFADGLVDKYHSFKIFDASNYLEANDIVIADKPLIFKKREVLVTAFFTTDEAAWADNYPKLYPNSEEIGVMVLLNTLTNTAQLKVALGNSLIAQSIFASRAEMQQFTASTTIDDLFAEPLSPKHLLDILNIEQPEPILNNLNVKTADEVKADRVSIGAVPSEESPQEKTKEKSKEKPKEPTTNNANAKNEITLTIGVFFDGTGNNRYNTELVYNKCIDVPTDLVKLKSEDFDLKFSEEKFKKLKEMKELFFYPYGVHKNENYMFDPDSSFSNPYSNIVLLHDIYQTKPYSPNNNNIVIKQYVQGIGTYAELDENGVPREFSEDDYLGTGFGRLDRGIVKRTKQAAELLVKQILAQLNLAKVELDKTKLHDSTKEKITIKSITFDIFGFSRGAAGARHFANNLMKSKKIIAGIDITQMEVSFFETIYGGFLGELLKDHSVSLPKPIIRFIGLFDTVVGDSANTIRQKINSFVKQKIEIPIVTINFMALDQIALRALDNIEMSLEKIDAKVLHLMAMNDWRENFPLILCHPLKTPEQKEIWVLGAHSDVGGGYSFQDYNTIIDYGDITNVEEEMHLNDFMITMKNAFSVVPNGNGTGSYNKDQIEIKYKWAREREFSALEAGKTESIRKHYQLIDKRLISNQLSLVYFNAMWQYALAQGVPFETNEKKFPKCNIGSLKNPIFVNFYRMKKDQDLLQYNQLVNKVVFSNSTQNLNVVVPGDLRCNILRNYVHISANYSKAKITKDEGDHAPDLLYINHPTKDGKRIILKPSDPRKSMFEEVFD